jgi:photosystem II stability/assembly factor-like uncharacterized protein
VSIEKARLALAFAALMSGVYADWVSIGPDGGNIVALALDPQQPATLYALPYEYPNGPRVFKTTTGGSAWTIVGLLPDSSVNQLLVDPHQSDYLYGMTSSTVWRSTDGGAAWDKYSLPTYGMSMAADPLVPGRLFASGYGYATYAVPAVMISTDYGQSWTTTQLDPDTGYAYSVAFDPAHSGTAYAGCAYGLVFKTTDGGANWDSACSGLPATASIEAIAVNSGNPDVVLAGANNGVYRSTDAGASWDAASGIAIAFDVALSPANPAIAYCLGYDTVPQLFVSTDSGATWVVQHGNLQLGKGGSLVTDPSQGDALYSPGVTGVMKATDRGANWAAVNSGIRTGSIPAISSGPWNPQAIYVEVTENAVFQSQSAGDTWTRCDDFLSCGAICGIGLAPGSMGDIVWALEGSG